MIANIAHRGASAYYTENTKSAVEEAMYQKAQMIEVDIRFTKDGIPVLFHDNTLWRLAGRRTLLSSFTYDQLRNIPLRNNERITSLDEFLSLVHGRMGVIMDVKDGRHERVLVDHIHKHKMIQHVIVSSSNVDLLKKIKLLESKIRIALIFRLRFNPVGLGRKLGLYSLHPQHLVVTSSLIARAHTYGMKVFPFTVNRSKRMRQLMGMGVDGIITNKPVLLRNVIHQFPHTFKSE